MIAQYENKIMSSMLLFLDHEICSKGEAFTNITDHPIYSIDVNYSNLIYDPSIIPPYSETSNEINVYALPFKQIIIDESITGANLCKGISVDGGGGPIFVSPGVPSRDGKTWSPESQNANPLNCILHHKGQFLLVEDLSPYSLTVTAAVKDFNIYISSKFEEDLLINTKYQLNPRINQTLAGLPDTAETFPAIFLKNMGGKIDPLAIGSNLGNVITKIRAVVMADSAFQLDAACSILKNTKLADLPIFESNNLPFNSIGGFTGVIYDYNIEASSASESVTIWDVNVTRLNPNSSGLKNLDAEVHSAFVDFEVHGIGKNS